MKIAVTAAELRSTVRMCADAWGVLTHPLCSAVSRRRLQEKASYVRTSARLDADSDERSYARLAIACTGCELVEFERKLADVASTRQATAVFSGDGRDFMFFRGWPELAGRRRYASSGNRSQPGEACLPSRPALSAFGLAPPGRCGSTAFLSGLGCPAADIHHYRLLTEEVARRVHKALNFLNPWNLPVADIPPVSCCMRSAPPGRVCSAIRWAPGSRSISSAGWWSSACRFRPGSTRRREGIVPRPGRPLQTIYPFVTR